MTKQSTDVWQDLMDAAYDTWDTANQTRAQFLASLPPVQREAVLVGNLNYQVCNGGWSQWVDNGYGLCARDVIPVLKKIGTPAALKTVEMVERIIPFVDFKAQELGAMGHYLNTRDETVLDAIYDAMDDMNEPFFAIADEFEADGDAYFRKVIQS